MNVAGKNSKRGLYSDTPRRENRWISILFFIIGISGLLYGEEKGFTLGGVTWFLVFTIISLYSLLVLRREGYEE